MTTIRSSARVVPGTGDRKVQIRRPKSARAATRPAEADAIRWEKVIEARRKLALGTYDTDAAIDGALTGLLRDLA